MRNLLQLFFERISAAAGSNSPSLIQQATNTWKNTPPPNAFCQEENNKIEKIIPSLRFVLKTSRLWRALARAFDRLRAQAFPDATVAPPRDSGTAKGFVFLSLEDETGIANIIIEPDAFERERFTVVGNPLLLIEGVLQNQDGVVSVKARKVEALRSGAVAPSHDFH